MTRKKATPLPGAAAVRVLRETDGTFKGLNPEH